MNERARELIHRRRRQVWVHAFMYYHLNETLVSDHQWDAWAQELAKLQRKHGARIGWADKHFADWDGSSGFHLPVHPWVVNKAAQLCRYHIACEYILTEPTRHTRRINRQRKAKRVRP